MFTKVYRKYEKYFSIIAFLLGFAIDNITLTRIDLWLDNLILGSYLFFAGFGIFMFHFLRRKPSKGKLRRRVVMLIPLLIQFAFGGLFSGYLIFYSRSASLATTWIFVFLIILLLIGNEFQKKHYRRLEFQIGMFFITLFSFAIFYVPIIFNSIGMGVFLLSGVVSLIAIWVFINILSLAIPKRIRRTRQPLLRMILFIYISFNVLYFTNIIPPIPLSMKEAGVYHFVERSGEGYVATAEVIKWYEVNRKLKTSVYVNEGDPVYVFSSIFAPTDLNTTVFHRWQYHDKNLNKWIESDQFRYKIFGGRDGGYRGYTTKQSIFPGKWRVDIVTGRGQIIGRVSFTIKSGIPKNGTETISF
jgi:hypothetical protein